VSGHDRLQILREPGHVGDVIVAGGFGTVETSSEYQVVGAEMGLFHGVERMGSYDGPDLRGSQQGTECLQNRWDLGHGGRSVQEYLANEQIPQIAVEGQPTSHLEKQWFLRAGVVEPSEVQGSRSDGGTKGLARLEAALTPGSAQSGAHLLVKETAVVEEEVKRHGCGTRKGGS
jgi:hypothetical protein